MSDNLIRGLMFCLDFASAAMERGLTFEQSLGEFQAAYPMFAGEDYAKAYKMAWDELLSIKASQR